MKLSTGIIRFFLLFVLAFSSNVMAMKTEKRNWTAAENAALHKAVAELGTKSWKAIGARINMPGRRCRDRWEYHEKPGINNDPITNDEYAEIVKWHAVYGGNRWADIAKQLPGRNPMQVKNAWNRKHRSPKSRAPEVAKIGHKRKAEREEITENLDERNPKRPCIEADEASNDLEAFLAHPFFSDEDLNYINEEDFATTSLIELRTPKGYGENF